MRAKTSKYARAAGAFVLASCVTSPISSAALYVMQGGFEGWAGNPLSDIIGWSLLALPTVLLFGIPIALLWLLVITEIWQPRSAVATVTAIVVAWVLFGLLISAPHNVVSPLLVQNLAAYAPLWIIYLGLVWGLGMVQVRPTRPSGSA